MLGDTEGAVLRGDVLALLLAGKVDEGVLLDLIAEGEAARAGRCGSDLAEPSPFGVDPDLGKMPGVDSEVEVNAAARAFASVCCPDGVVVADGAVLAATLVARPLVALGVVLDVGEIFAVFC